MANTKSACFDELSHLVLDNDQNVTIKSISNAWDVSTKLAVIWLKEWILKNEKSNKFVQKFILKGVDKNGNGLITIVSEDKVDVLQKKLNNVSTILHSVETRSDTSRKAAPQKYENSKIIKLEIKDSVKRVAPHVPSPFISVSIQKEVRTELIQVKKENSTIQNVPGLFSKTSPKESVPKAKKTLNKNSIASFFSTNKPNVSQPVSKVNESNNVSPQPESSELSLPKLPTKVKNDIELKNEDDIKLECASKSLKASLYLINGDNENDSPATEEDTTIKLSTPQENPKKILKKRTRTNDSEKSFTNARKRSRILELEDSSDEEKSALNPGHQDHVVITVGGSTGNKPKAKRIVSKIYEFDNGFIRTVKEPEEYECSDNETSVKMEQTKKPEVKEVKVTKLQPTKKVASKQGSITSFFSKK